METSLHRQLKERFGPGSGGRSEVVVGGFRIDAVAADGSLVEVQSGPLGPLQAKLRQLLPEHRVRVVKPVVLSRRVVRRARRDGPDLSVRFSSKRGAVHDVFDDLVGLARVFPHPNLRLDVLGVEIDEVRIPHRRWPGFAVCDRGLRDVVATVLLGESADLWHLIPKGAFEGPFTTRDLAERLGRPLTLAQRVAFCLRLAGAVERVGTRDRYRVYVPQSAQERPGERKRINRASRLSNGVDHTPSERNRAPRPIGGVPSGSLPSPPPPDPAGSVGPGLADSAFSRPSGMT